MARSTAAPSWWSQPLLDERKRWPAPVRGVVVHHEPRGELQVDGFWARSAATVEREECSALCHYCGCRDTPLIRDYIAEHERATDLGGEAVRALDRGEFGVANRLLRAMLTELRSHWDGEEHGLFAVMARDELYAEHIRPLVREHRELAQLLSTVDVGDPVDQQRVRTAVLELRGHIAKEEDGLFPASLSALTGEEWDASMQAWHDAHPGERMVGE